MNKSTTLSPSQKLECLLELFESDASIAGNNEISALLEMAWEELEENSLLHPTVQQLLQDALEAADQELHQRGTAFTSLRRIVQIYRSGGAYFELRDSWAQELASIPPDRLETSSWRDLQKALDAAVKGKNEAVIRWVEKMEERFLGALQQYEDVKIMAREVTAETVLCHQYLIHGVECWLRALALLTEGLDQGLDREAVENAASEGQRNLVFLQTRKKELQQQLVLRRNF